MPNVRLAYEGPVCQIIASSLLTDDVRLTAKEPRDRPGGPGAQPVLRQEDQCERKNDSLRLRTTANSAALKIKGIVAWKQAALLGPCHRTWACQTEREMAGPLRQRDLIHTVAPHLAAVEAFMTLAQALRSRLTNICSRGRFFAPNPGTAVTAV